MLLNVGSGGGAAAAAPAAGGAAAGGAAAEEAPKEEAKEEGEFSPTAERVAEGFGECWLTCVCVLQRRRNRMRTWASVCSIKRLSFTRGNIEETVDIRDRDGGHSRIALLCCEVLDYVAAKASCCVRPSLHLEPMSFSSPQTASIALYVTYRTKLHQMFWPSLIPCSTPAVTYAVSASQHFSGREARALSFSNSAQIVHSHVPSIPFPPLQPILQCNEVQMCAQE